MPLADKTNRGRSESGDSLRISVVCTVRNESGNIRELVHALLEQDLQPEELIIVDGGSTDDTLSVLRDLATTNPRLKVLYEPEANIARGRNIGIDAASNDIVAVTDAGARPQKDWLKNLADSMDHGVDVVAGFYLPDARSRFEWLVGELTYPKVENVIPESFLPSSRSVMFRRKCWSEVGGYPEESLTAEDTLFDLRLKQKGYNFRFAKDAIVLWRCRGSFAALFRQWMGYATGDGLLGLVFANKQSKRHYAKILAEGYESIALILAGFLIHGAFFGLLAALLSTYLFLYYFERKGGREVHKKTKYLPYLLIGPAMVGVIHLGQFIGIHVGTLRRILNK